MFYFIVNQIHVHPTNMLSTISGFNSILSFKYIYIYNEPSLRIRDDKIASGQANFQSSYGHFTVGKLNGLENPNHIHICKLGSNNEQTSLKI